MQRGHICEQMKYENQWGFKLIQFAVKVTFGIHLNVVSNASKQIDDRKTWTLLTYLAEFLNCSSGDWHSDIIHSCTFGN